MLVTWPQRAEMIQHAIHAFVLQDYPHRVLTVLLFGGFDLLVPGGGLGDFNGCNKMFPALKSVPQDRRGGMHDPKDCATPPVFNRITVGFPRAIHSVMRSNVRLPPFANIRPSAANLSRKCSCLLTRARARRALCASVDADE